MTTANGRVLVVAAHPDDPEFLAGGTVARLAKEGREIAYVIVTNVNKGSGVRSAGPDGLLKPEVIFKATALRPR
jgi:LmbE family N-acetylglucosaminyl deacetylase